MHHDDPRNVLVKLVDEVGRLSGRLKSGFAATRRGIGLNESELTVLNAVVEGQRPPTASQIGRSLGIARQIVQRAANALMSRGLIEAAPNPDHKRAALLIATPAGLAIKAEADRIGNAAAERLAAGIDLAAAHDAVTSLRAVRKSLESYLRGRDD